MQINPLYVEHRICNKPPLRQGLAGQGPEGGAKRKGTLPLYLRINKGCVGQEGRRRGHALGRSLNDLCTVPVAYRTTIHGNRSKGPAINTESQYPYTYTQVVFFEVCVRLTRLGERGWGQQPKKARKGEKKKGTMYESTGVWIFKTPAVSQLPLLDERKIKSP